MNLNTFKIKLLNDIRLTYPDAKLDGDSLVVECKNRLIDFSLIELFAEYNLTKDYTSILNEKVRNIEVFGNYTRTDLALKSVFPLVKSKGSVDVEKYNLEEFSIFLDLSCFLVQDTDEILRFIPKDKTDNRKLYDKAINNLSEIDIRLELVDKTLQIYAYYGIDYAASLLMIREKIEEVVNMLGDTFLFAASNSDSLAFMPDSLENYLILERIIKHDPLPRLSENIYRFSCGNFSYADPHKRLQLIK